MNDMHIMEWNKWNLQDWKMTDWKMIDRNGDDKVNDK